VVRTSLTADELGAVMEFDLALKLPNQDELNARISRGELLSPADLEAYLPTKADYDSIRSWLVAQGFKISLDATTRHAIFAKGTNARVAAVFGVTLARVTTADGEFTSAVSEPSLPDEVAGPVAGIRGLQPHIVRHPHRSQKALQLTSNTYWAITPAAVAATYQAPASLSGSGQTIAVVGASSVKNSDLTSFWNDCGIPQSLTNISTVNVGAGPGSDVTDQDEVSMDVEWTSGFAPGAQVRLYATPYPMDSNGEARAYTQILNDLATHPTIHQVTESYGGTEAPFLLNHGDSALPLLAAQGVTCFASSGDGGSNANATSGAYDPTAPLSVEYPAVDPNMTGVGGTTIQYLTSQNGSPSLPEVAWSVGASGSSGTSGGISTIFTRPGWQSAPGMPTGTMRCVPDVAALADTAITNNDNVHMGPIFWVAGNAKIGGGTSLSSPIWAATCALINQARANLSQSPVGFLNPKLYQAAGTSCFTDITSGTNGAYQAGTGYDLCTGLGSPSIANLVTFLTRLPGFPTITTQPAGQSITNGNSVSCTVVATGSPTPTYQWLKNNVDISGATNSTFTIASVSPSDAGSYTVIVTNSIGSVTSNAAVLTVLVGPFNAVITITVQ